MPSNFHRTHQRNVHLTGRVRFALRPTLRRRWWGVSQYAGHTLVLQVELVLDQQTVRLPNSPMEANWQSHTTWRDATIADLIQPALRDLIDMQRVVPPDLHG